MCLADGRFSAEPSCFRRPSRVTDSTKASDASNRSSFAANLHDKFYQVSTKAQEGVVGETAKPHLLYTATDNTPTASKTKIKIQPEPELEQNNEGPTNTPHSTSISPEKSQLHAQNDPLTDHSVSHESSQPPNLCVGFDRGHSRLFPWQSKINGPRDETKKK